MIWIEEVINCEASIKIYHNKIKQQRNYSALTVLIASLIVQFGINIRGMGIVNTICSILILLGALNDPTQNTSAYISGVSDKLINKEQAEVKSFVLVKIYK